MQRFILALVACLTFSALTQAEVVIASTANGASAISAGASVLKTFETSASPYWSITNINFGFTIGASSSATFSSVKAYLYEQTTGTSYNRLASYDFGSFSNSTATDYFFSSDPGAGWQNLSGNKAYFIGLETVGSVSGSVNWLQSSGDSGAWSGVSSSLVGTAPFSSSATYNTSTGTSSFGSTLFLEVTAVPEPGTFLLGAIAATSCAAGAWRKRRKGKNTQGETTALGECLPK